MINDWVAKAVEFLLQNLNKSIPESMTAIQLFSPSEVSNRSIQQRVRRAYNKSKANIPKCVSAPTVSPNLSPITTPSTKSASSKSNSHSNEDLDVSEALMQLSASASRSAITEEGSAVRKKRNSANVKGVKEIRLTSLQAMQKR